MSNPIRVLQVVGTMDLGGAETFLMNLYRNIDRDKIQFDFLCQNRINSAYTDEIYSMGGRMYKVDGPSHAGFFGYMKQLDVFFSGHQEYPIVHAHQFNLNGIILRSAKKFGIPNRYSHSHCSVKKQNIVDGVTKSILSLYINKSNITRSFACAKAAGDCLYRGDLKKKCYVIPNAINAMQFGYSENSRKKIREEFGFRDELVIGHVGRFDAVKNHSFIIDVFSEIVKCSHSSKLILVGEGQLKNEIEKKIEHLNLKDNILCTGSRNNIHEMMSAFDLLLFPSHAEGLSVACVEAQASGLPILTSTNVSSEICLTDLVEQKPLTDSKESWAETVLRMVSKRNTADRLKYAKRIVDIGFDVKALSSKMRDLYLRDAQR